MFDPHGRPAPTAVTSRRPSAGSDVDLDADGPVVSVLRVLVVALALVALATPVVLTSHSWREDVLFNADEAVAALLPVEFARGGTTLLFPDNAYQGLVELPAYGLLWFAGGADPVPMRVLHQAMWLGAVALWFAAALGPARSDGRIGTRAYWWAALTVAGTLAVTSVVGWPVWSRIYPGYHAGALLGGLAAWCAVRALRSPPAFGWWFTAGLTGGLAVYAQPMHAAGVVVVAAVALAAGPGRPARLGLSGLGALVGVAPLLVWNLGHDWATLDRRRQPVVEHPDWGYTDRLAGMVRSTGRVLWGGDQLPDGAAPGWVATACAVALAVLAVVGVVALLRWRGASPALLAAPAVMVLGLPLLSVMSLESDPRYAVGWWPAAVVLVGAGAAAASQLRGVAGRALRVALAALVVAHLGVVVAGARALADRPAPRMGTVDATLDLAQDLRRCGVDAVWGSYWRVYPVLWATEADMDGAVVWGPQRLDELAPGDAGDPSRVAVLPPPEMDDMAAAATVATEGTGRGALGWVALVHTRSGVAIALESTEDELPLGCVGLGGLEPLPAG